MDVPLVVDSYSGCRANLGRCLDSLRDGLEWNGGPSRTHQRESMPIPAFPLQPGAADASPGLHPGHRDASVCQAAPRKWACHMGNSAHVDATGQGYRGDRDPSHTFNRWSRLAPGQHRGDTRDPSISTSCSRRDCLYWNSRRISGRPGHTGQHRGDPGPPSRYHRLARATGRACPARPAALTGRAHSHANFAKAERTDR